MASDLAVDTGRQTEGASIHHPKGRSVFFKQEQGILVTSEKQAGWSPVESSKEYELQLSRLQSEEKNALRSPGRNGAKPQTPLAESVTVS